MATLTDQNQNTKCTQLILQLLLRPARSIKDGVAHSVCPGKLSLLRMRQQSVPAN